MGVRLRHPAGESKGGNEDAHDVRTIAALSLGVMIAPVYVAVEVAGGQGSIYRLAVSNALISALGVAFMLRYRQGSWKTMRVIEHLPPGVQAGEREQKR